MGQRDGASPLATPATPPPECLEAHSHSSNKPLTTAALVETNHYSHNDFIYEGQDREGLFVGTRDVPSRPSLDFGESAGRQ